EVREQGLRADLSLRAVGEDLELAVLQSGREIDGDRVAPPTPPQAVLQGQRVGYIEDGRQDDDCGERDDRKPRPAAHRRSRSIIPAQEEGAMATRIQPTAPTAQARIAERRSRLRRSTTGTWLR